MNIEHTHLRDDAPYVHSHSRGDVPHGHHGSRYAACNKVRLKVSKREAVAKYIYEHHHPRMYHTWEELKGHYAGSAEAIMQEADEIIAICRKSKATRGE